LHRRSTLDLRPKPTINRRRLEIQLKCSLNWPSCFPYLLINANFAAQVHGRSIHAWSGGAQRAVQRVIAINGIEDGWCECAQYGHEQHDRTDPRGGWIESLLLVLESTSDHRQAR